MVMNTLRFSADSEIKTSLLQMYEVIATSPTHSVRLEAIGARASGLLMKLISKIKYPITEFHSETRKLKAEDTHFTLVVNATVSSRGERCEVLSSAVPPTSGILVVSHQAERRLPQQIAIWRTALKKAKGATMMAFGKQIGLALIIMHRTLTNDAYNLSLCLHEDPKGTQFFITANSKDMYPPTNEPKR